MPHPEYENMIDGYLLGRLSEEEAERFERHYFECPECFHETAERALLVEAAKAAGPAPAAVKLPVRTSAFRRVSPGWAAAAGAAVLLAAAALLFFPRSPKPLDFPDAGIRSVRGGTLELVGPAETIPEAPGELSWKAVEGATVYSVVIEGINPSWTAETRDSTIPVPTEVAARMSPGRTYFWRVKAYAAEGTLLAASARTPFTIGR
ncbi:MAG: zf-HC2 domain-containing protein [Candidatus Aminicenantes bacterium]|nr:zf-HC2 domain-containing protein [Candidatus Aminicenantes bacterium]